VTWLQLCLVVSCDNNRFVALPLSTPVNHSRTFVMSYCRCRHQSIILAHSLCRIAVVDTSQSLSHIRRVALPLSTPVNHSRTFVLSHCRCRHQSITLAIAIHTPSAFTSSHPFLTSPLSHRPSCHWATNSFVQPSAALAHSRFLLPRLSCTCSIRLTCLPSSDSHSSLLLSLAQAPMLLTRHWLCRCHTAPQNGSSAVTGFKTKRKLKSTNFSWIFSGLHPRLQSCDQSSTVLCVCVGD
jgi:hypothetical protein